jgi:proteasome lid subunit RPN8/RPN11
LEETKMKILHRALESIVAHARESWPSECCGILLSPADDPTTVQRALRAENAERTHPQGAYVLGHKAHIKAVGLEASAKASIVGYYHSHPDGWITPSPRDEGQAVEGVIYLIVGGGRGKIEYAAWRMQGENFSLEPLEVIG